MKNKKKPYEQDVFFYFNKNIYIKYNLASIKNIIKSNTHSIIKKVLAIISRFLKKQPNIIQASANYFVLCNTAIKKKQMLSNHIASKKFLTVKKASIKC